MSFVVEPIDYAMTAVQCVTDGCSLAEVALTVVPGAVSNKFINNGGPE